MTSAFGCGPNPCQWRCGPTIQNCAIITTFDGNSADWNIISGSMTGGLTSANYHAETTVAALREIQNVSLNFDLDPNNVGGPVDISLETAGCGIRIHGSYTLGGCLNLDVLQSGTPISSTKLQVLNDHMELRLTTRTDGRVCVQAAGYSSGEIVALCEDHTPTSGTPLVFKDVYGGSQLDFLRCGWGYGDTVWICNSFQQCAIGSWSWNISYPACWWTVLQGSFSGGVLDVNSEIQTPMSVIETGEGFNIQIQGNAPGSSGTEREWTISAYDLELYLYYPENPLTPTGPIPPAVMELRQGGSLLRRHIDFSYGAPEAWPQLCVQGNDVAAFFGGQWGMVPIYETVAPLTGQPDIKVKSGPATASPQMYDFAASVIDSVHCLANCPEPICTQCSDATPDPLFVQIPNYGNDACADCAGMGGLFELRIKNTDVCVWELSFFQTLCGNSQAHRTITASIEDRWQTERRYLRVVDAASIPFGGVSNFGAYYEIDIGPQGTPVQCSQEYTLPNTGGYGDLCVPAASVVWMPAAAVAAAPAPAMVKGRDGRMKPRVALGKRQGGG